MADDNPTSSGDDASFSFIECKEEPDTCLDNSIDESLSTFDKSIQLQFPVFIPAIKSPIVLLERCDKIWETLQLIKNMQIEKSSALTDDCEVNDEKKKEEEEEETQCLDKIKESLIEDQTKKYEKIPIPFKISVQSTKKLYPCATCGKQYLERRSLRKHSEKIHGVILPLLIRRKRLKHATSRKKYEANKVASVKENNNLEKYSSEKIMTKVSATSTVEFITCTLCQQEVTSLRNHLINYHKIGSSSRMVKQLESSLLNKTASTKNGITTSEKQNSRIIDNKSNARKKFRMKRMRKDYTISYDNPAKKMKLNNHSKLVQDPAVQNEDSSSQYKCDVCLGIYSSINSFYKHRRIHKLRGETKENFHKFRCRYFNSPFNKKYQLLAKKKSSMISNSADDKVVDNNTSQQNTSVNQTSKVDRASRYNERMKKLESTCICGRLFRNPHTLFIHKKNCELYQNEDSTESTKDGSDKDSSNGINITIKKRNDSYEIVGKDDEDKSEMSDTSNLQKESLSASCPSSTKDLTETSQEEQDKSSSKYSKDHSILKLEDVDEDVIIDIEDDVQMPPDENNITQQTVAQNGDTIQDKPEEQSNDTENKKSEKIIDTVSSLKQMCRQVLEALEMNKSENIESKNKENNQTEGKKAREETNEIQNEEIHQTLFTRNLRSKRYSRMQLDHFYDGLYDDTIQYDPLICGYCNERFGTNKSYDNHQCPVKHGKSFDEFSLKLPCFCCKEILNNYNEFDEHVRDKHFAGVYHCYYCPERFMNDKARSYHFQAEHNDLVCRFCNKKISPSVKGYHEGYHLGFGYPCHQCKKAYTSSRSLNLHIQTIHSKNYAENLMTCTICLKCIKVHSFRKHMSTHKHNTCHFCSKVFSDRIGIEYHTMMHHGTNTKLKCNTCGTRFHTKKQLEVHEKIDGCNNDIQ